MVSSSTAVAWTAPWVAWVMPAVSLVTSLAWKRIRPGQVEVAEGGGQILHHALVGLQPARQAW